MENLKLNSLAKNKLEKKNFAIQQVVIILKQNLFVVVAVVMQITEGLQLMIMHVQMPMVVCANQ